MTEVAPDRGLHHRHPRRPADQDDALHLGLRRLPIAKHPADRGDRPIDERPHDRLEALARDAHGQFAIGERARELGVIVAGQLFLGGAGRYQHGALVLRRLSGQAGFAKPHAARAASKYRAPRRIAPVATTSKTPLDNEAANSNVPRKGVIAYRPRAHSRAHGYRRGVGSLISQLQVRSRAASSGPGAEPRRIRGHRDHRAEDGVVERSSAR